MAYLHTQVQPSCGLWCLTWYPGPRCSCMYPFSREHSGHKKLMLFSEEEFLI